MRGAHFAIALLAVASLVAVHKPVPSYAHTTSTGLAELTIAGATLTYRLTLVLSELPDGPARMLAAAAAGDEASAQRAAATAREKVTVRADGTACIPGRTRLQGSRLGDARVTLEITLQCARTPARLVVRDDWFDLFGEHYRTLARLEGPGGVREAAFLPDAREAEVDFGAPAPRLEGGFFWLGVEHILTGYDHLLFLAALLLGGGGALALFKIATAFTLAHSITLAIAVVGLASAPARVVEPLIAASIVWVAIENVWLGHAPSRRWLVSFGFGLVHGFGFASALEPLALPPWSLAAALVGFNLGVEAGQAAVIVLFLPLGLWMGRWPGRPRVTRALSLVLALVGLAWFVQRLLAA